MFGLSTKKQEEPQYSEAITMVHDEFNSAGERLYQEALKIINSTKLLNEEKVQRLKKLGFTATKEVVEAEEVLQKRKMNEDMVNTIAYYKERYPLNKFITEDQVKEICKKYGLIYGKISEYTGFVPEKNMSRIEAFSVKEEDIPYVTNRWGQRPKLLSREEALSINESNESVYEIAKATLAINKNSDVSHLYASYQPILALKEFLIAAPQKDFKVTDKHEIKNFKLSLKPVPDPVILAPVIGGYLIVTAWGDEASDPLVQNEINN